jgi:cytosine/adenosine deaminase-related metal-dependent hydrolase
MKRERCRDYSQRVAQRCDLLLTNAHVVTMDERFTVWNPGAVAIAAGAIVEVGAIESRYDASERVDCRGRVVMPGLINAHTHAPMTLLRGLSLRGAGSENGHYVETRPGPCPRRRR